MSKMFGQFRPWLDCDRHCSFCYIDHNKSKMTDAQKANSLMVLSAYISYPSRKCDTIGLIGGELFQDDKFFHEWCCVAESIRNADHIKRLFIGTHLLGDIDALLDFCDMVAKEIQICTSYDTNGRFFGDDYDTWLKNIKKVQDAGYKVVCSSTLTDAFIHDDFDVPEGVDFKLQPIFVSEEWLEAMSEWCSDPTAYHSNMKVKMAGTLARREDVLKWFTKHKDVAKVYSTYDDKHASYLWDYDKGDKEYHAQDFVCTNYLAECGHPMIARCYADSDKCTMCDAKEMSE